VSIRRAFQGGFQVSLHPSKPSVHGRPILAGPFRVHAGALEFGASVIQNRTRLVWGPVEQSGRVTYVALWSLRGEFERAFQLAKPIRIAAGETIVVDRGKLRVLIGD